MATQYELVASAGAPAAPDGVTDDAFLGGKLAILQPAKGYRAGVDPVILAASVDARSHGRILDIGAGVGTAGLCVAARLPRLQVTLLERDERLIELARQNAIRNSLDKRVVVVSGDVTATASLLEQDSVAAESFDQAIANPPFHDDARGTASPLALKNAAHAMPARDLDQWVRLAVRVLKPKGTLTLIHKVASLEHALQALNRRFGAVVVRPVHAFADAPAIRVLVRAVKGSKAPMTLAPPLILHSAPGKFTPLVEDILRHGRGLDLMGGTV